jgi:hypothetical protein
VSITRSVFSRPSGMVSPDRQSGTAVFSVDGSAGAPVFLFEPVEESAHSVSLPLSVGTERHREPIRRAGGEPNACQYLGTERRGDEHMARVEIGGRREGQEVWARWIDGTVQGDREFLKVAGLDPDTRFEDPHAFVELIQALLDKGSATVVLDIPPGPSPSPL